MYNIFKIIGVIGLVAIIFGVVTKKRPYQDMFFICGGICLEIYSIYLRDIIFIILEAVFILAAVYDLLKMLRLKNFKKQ